MLIVLTLIVQGTINYIVHSNYQLTYHAKKGLGSTNPSLFIVLSKQFLRELLTKEKNPTNNIRI